MPGTAVDWLDTFVGVNFGDRKPTYGSYEPLNVNRVHFAVPEDGDVSKSTGRGGSGFISALKAKLDEYIAAGNACLLLESPVTDIVIEDGTITGVVAQINGVETTIKAPSTIIATGGYGHNEAWLKEYNFTNVATSTPPARPGSGYDFARKAGAGVQRHGFLHGIRRSHPGDGLHQEPGGKPVHQPRPDLGGSERRALHG